MLQPKKVKHRKWSRFCLRCAEQQNRGSSILRSRIGTKRITYVTT